ncbi:sugar O-acetyltransferase [Aeromonas veronii]|uniref:sugar O-acetyltransferase n=1 Tax=Aeromonas veronii TaxID=654 RepID=UPI002B49102B|nr:sugar O-acetyltransferase [Aeromonas veronii]
MEKVVRGTEWQKMVAGEPYDAADPELKAARERCRRLYHTFNTSWQEKPARDALLHELLGGRGQECAINSPFFCDYGANIFVGENFYANVGCTILDVCEVHIGDNVLLAPRIRGVEFGKPVRIGHNVWIGGSVVICPGVTIGDNSVIGAGSVVTKDVPANVVAAGNPCKVLRPMTAQELEGVIQR